MASPEVTLEHILMLAGEFGPDDKGRYAVGRINAKFLQDGFTPSDWKIGITTGEKAGKLTMDKCGSFFTIPTV